MNKKITVYGLGKLGATMLACFAHKGWEVVGVDLNESSVDSVNRGESPIYEPGVDKLLKDNIDRISATTDGFKAFLTTDISFIIVPTPSEKEGYFSLEYVLKVAEVIGPALREKKTYHLVVVTSTVMPGDTEKVKCMLEAISGKKCGKDFGVCYNPDFIALGQVIHDFLNPDMILIGQSDDQAGLILEDIHQRLINNAPEIHRMSFENAELAKIGLNAYCTMKINFANVIGEICEKMPGGNSDNVLKAIGSDKRVGKKYFRAGLSASGPCFPRDGRAFRFASSKLGVVHTYAGITDNISTYHKRIRIPNVLSDILTEKEISEISILGLTYKENVSIVDESVPVEVVRKLSEKNYTIRVYDPAGMDHAQEELSNVKVTFTNSIKECLSGISLCFVGTEWSHFKKLTLADFVDTMGRNPTIVDAWSIYRGTEIESSPLIDYRRIGKNVKTSPVIK